MTARVADRPVLRSTTKTAGPTDVFFLRSGFTGMLSLRHWANPKYIPRAVNLRAHYNDEVIPDQMEDYALNSLTPVPKMNYTVLKEQIEQVYRNRPECNISYSDLMDVFPSADLMDIVQICSELVEEGKIAALEA